MTLEALGNLAKIGKIKAEPMNRAEIDRMLVVARSLSTIGAGVPAGTAIPTTPHTKNP